MPTVTRLAEESTPADDREPTLLNKIRNARLIPSSDPQGLFIDKVLITPDSILDPTTGLRFDSLQPTEEGRAAVFRNDDGQSFTLPLSQP